MFESFKHRSHRLERLDTGDYTPAEYAKWQREMWFIHRVFGEIRALKKTLGAEIRRTGGQRVSILDVGAGSGELLLGVSKLTGDKAFAAGVEINAEAARSIRTKGIPAIRSDALCLPFADGSFDYVYCSLFLHHLTDEMAIELLGEMRRVARRRMFVVDLHRSPVAYYFYRLASRIFLQRFTREDGALSILRSFKPDELRTLANEAGLNEIKVERSAAYRLVLSGK